MKLLGLSKREPSRRILVIPGLLFTLLLSSNPVHSQGEYSFQNAPGGRSPRPVRGLAERPRRPARILVDPSDPSEIPVVVGQAVQLTPLVLDNSGGVIPGVEFEFQSIAPGVATVDPTGRISGHSLGYSTLTVSAGGLLATATINVVGVQSGVIGFEPTGLAQDLAGRLYLTNSLQHTILRTQNLLESAQLYAGIENMSGFNDGELDQALFDQPAFLTLNQQDSSLWISDAFNNRIRRALPDGVETAAGNGIPGSQDGSGNQAEFNNPQGIAIDDQGSIWIADSGNHTIRRLIPAFDDQGRLDRSLVQLETVAGMAMEAGCADGQGQAARFDTPIGLAVEREPLAEKIAREAKPIPPPPPPVRVVVADGNGTIRRVSENGLVETVAGACPGTVSSSRAGASSNTRSSMILARPFAVAADPSGTLYVTDFIGRLLAILPNGEVVPVLPEGSLAAPKGIAVTQSGQLIVADLDAVAITLGRPNIDSLDPSQAGILGGEPITIRGGNFAPESVVVVGASVIEDALVQDTQTIIFMTPPLESGLTTLTVLNRGGLAQFPFLAVPTELDQLEPGRITTVAGGSSFVGDGASALQASLARPGDVAVDVAGNLYIADSSHDRIRRVDFAAGLITTVAGVGIPPAPVRRGEVEPNGAADLGDGGPGPAAFLNFPLGVAVDGVGRVFIADSSNHRIRMLDPATGIITTVAGDGGSGFSGDGPASSTALPFPRDLALDAVGNLFIASQHRIRRVEALTQTLSTIAGDDSFGFSGDGQAADQALLNNPRSVATDSAGNLYIADYRNHRVRRIDAQGLIETIAGNGTPGFSGDEGQATQASLDFPSGVALDSEGNLYVADSFNHRIRRVDGVTEVISTLAGDGVPDFNGDGTPASQASLNFPAQVSVDAAGNLYLADQLNHRIRRVDSLTQLISTLAGMGEPEAANGDGGAAIAAALFAPEGIDFNLDGDLFIADSSSHRVRRVSGATKSIQTVAGGGEGFQDGGQATDFELDFPYDVAADGRDLVYIADLGNHSIRRVDLVTGILTTMAGTGQQGFSGDGASAVQARLRAPISVALGPDGNIYIADTENHRVRMVDLETGIIDTVAGDGSPAFSGDGEPAQSASLFRPSGIAVDSAGRLFIADRQNNRVRLVDPADGTISTIAGDGSIGFSGDEGPAVEAQLARPFDLALDGLGNLFIATPFHQRVRMVDLTTGIITTVAGDGGSAFSADGVPATETSLASPFGLAVDPSGNLHISEEQGNRIRAVRR